MSRSLQTRSDFWNAKGLHSNRAGRRGGSAHSTLCKTVGNETQQSKCVLIAKMLEREQEVSRETILTLSMIFIVSLQRHSQIMTLCYCTNNAGSSFSSGNNYSILSYSVYHQLHARSPLQAQRSGSFGARLRKVLGFSKSLKAVRRRHILTQKQL